jgi:hypothetical protein
MGCGFKCENNDILFPTNAVNVNFLLMFTVKTKGKLNAVAPTAGIC